LERKQSEEWQSRASRTLNSTACFSIAYVIVTYMLWFVTGLAGLSYKFDSFVYYYGIKFILNSHSWTKFKVMTVYSSGPLFLLLMAFGAAFFYNRLKTIKTLLNLFFLWIFIIGISIFIGQLVIGTLGINNYNSIYYQGLAVSFSWLRIPKFLLYILDVLAFFMLVYVGMNSARPFMVFSFSYSKINNLTRRRRYFFETAVVPFILGTLITIVAIFPKELTAKNVLILLASTHLIYIAIMAAILGIGWLSLAYMEMSKQDLVRYKSLQIPNIMAILFVLVLWAYVYVTFRGIYLRL
jgi:hypothetical protein